MNVGSLFSGIGGIELGLERAGFETAWFVECELHAQAILRKHWPNAIIYDDVTKLDFKDVPKVDVLTGGFPCQDISNAGKRAGIEGSRSGLWKYYLKAISEIRPRYALIENVAALTRRGLDVVLCDLAQIGYDAEWHCISASSVGAPHRRDRVFIVAYPSSGGLQGAQHRGSCSSRTPQGEGCEQADWSEGFSDASSNVADTDCERFPSCRTSPRSQQEESEGSCTRPKPKCFPSSQNWATEPDVGRVAHGVPNRVDRIKRLGNAVVPACAEAIGKAIKEVEKCSSVIHAEV